MRVTRNRINFMIDPIVVAKGLTRQVKGPGGDLTILREINLEVVKGEALAISGPSGSGKSTLLGQLAGLDSPTAGNVYLFGKNLSSLDEDGKAALRAGQVGFVFQMFHLIRNLTALENVELALDLSGQNDCRAEAETLLKEVGLKHRMHHMPQQLSGGEQQRVALARAFVVKPRVLFADEPTGNLDEDTGTIVSELLFRLQREQGSALILVTHDFQLASRCDRILRMEAGRLICSEE